MKVYEQHEQFEMLVLDEMRKLKILNELIFGGGTMLRLCYDLPRYSVDFDFYLKKEASSFKLWSKKMTEHFIQAGFEITDQKEKHFTYLWEIRGQGFPRRLKIEIRKDVTIKLGETQLMIAHSFYTTEQVKLRALTLERMWQNKIKALTERKEIRDAYDLEFLTQRTAGDFRSVSKEILHSLITILESFRPNDYKVTIGSVLMPEERERVLSSKFSYLRSKIQGAI